ncbi:MAG: bifunctional UDP-N-acetylglucosamine diphosphorylase/glucosamine-1-phosphate N-acetyltransferase GlmU [Acidobacteriota bacterium]
MSSTPDPMPRVAVVLAAGQGRRMHSALPKPLHPVAGRAMVLRVLDAARAAGCDRLVVVVGHGADTMRAAVRDAFADGPQAPVFVEQREQLGTGHALQQAERAIEDAATVLVLSGDVPLVRPATLESLAARCEATGRDALAVATVAEPGRLGRVIADDGRLVRIVEAADASEDELEIHSINAGLYALRAPEIFEALRNVQPNNAQGEIYLTDALHMAVATGEPPTLIELADASEAWGVNNRRQLAAAHRRLIDRHLNALADRGVTVLDPATTTVEPEVEIGRDTTLHPGTTVLGASRVGSGCTLHHGAWLRDTTLGDDVEIQPYCVLDGSRLEAATSTGPFARLRPGSVLETMARVGTFVETKNTTLEAGAKANHLAYLGDATIGADSNVGAGVVTCNYDGRRKHRTEVGREAFVGSDTMLVAPVRIGDGAYTGAGSVITKDVPDGALAVGRARQRTIEGWAATRRDDLDD